MGEGFVQQADPEAVFQLLADETRLGVLRALWESDPRPMTFSELHDAVGVRDSGRFNYHLDKLVGQFVAKTGDGYRLTQAGKQVNGAIASGAYTARGAIDPIALDHACRMCGGALTLYYDDETARIECDSCPSGWAVTVPPGVLAEYDRPAFPRIVSRYLATEFRRIAAGFCSYCNGRVEPTVGPLEAMEVGPSPANGDAARAPDHPVVEFDCQRCGHVSGISLDHGLLLVEPAVDRFYHDHGIDVREYPVWGIPDLHPERAEIERGDSTRATVTFRIEGSTLTVTVDQDFDVVDIET